MNYKAMWEEMKQFHKDRYDESLGLISYTREGDALKRMERIERKHKTGHKQDNE